MKGDLNIKKQIEQALEANPLFSLCRINAEVNDGNAVLYGSVDQYCKKEIAKKIAKDVEGTKLVTENLKILLNDNEKSSDNAILAAIQEKFLKNFGNAHTDVKVTVNDGYVWLDGHLNWKYQKDLAVECINGINGIKGIDNHIFVPEKAESPINEKDILAAIYGDYSITSEIKVEIFGRKVILEGSVDNANQKNLITRLVRNVPGVNEVENFITVNRREIR